MYLRFKLMPAKRVRYAAGVSLALTIAVLTALVLYAPEALAQPNVAVKKVLERDKGWGAASIVTNGDTYLYSGELGDTFISTDGLHWAQSSINVQVEGEQEAVSVNGSKLLWDGKQFITFQSDLLATSKDGVSWTGKRIKFDTGLGDHAVFRALLRDSKKYVAITQPTATSKGGFSSVLQFPHQFYYSYDLRTWHQGTGNWTFNPSFNVNTPSINNIAWNGKDIYLVGGEQQMYSKDGIHWEGNIGRGDSDKGVGKRNGSGANGQQYSWDGKKFWLASGQKIKSSIDGEQWTVEYTASDSSVTLDTIGYNGRAYLATGPSKSGFVFYYSLNGKNWEKVTSGGDTASGTQQVLPVKGGFLVAGSDIYWISDTAWNTPSGWASGAIAQAERNRLVKSDLLRAYNTPITRSEFSKTAIRLYEALTAQETKPASTNPFLDTARPDVLKAYALGIVQGQGNGFFNPDDPITRQDLAVMFYRTIKAAEAQVTPSQSWQSAYVDLEDVSAYAEEALRTLNEANIVNGKDGNRLAPLDKTSREEAFVMAERIFEKYETGQTIDAGPASGFESIKGFLENKGYIVLPQEETSINGSPVLQSYVVQNTDSQTVLSYNKIDPTYQYASGLYRKLYIHRYEAGAKDDVMELSKQIIEQEKGVEFAGLSEFLANAAQTGLNTPTNKGVNTFIMDENDPDLVVNFIAYWGGKNNLIIEINY